jgi:hypothetical protein
MILNGANEITGDGGSPSVTLSNTDSTWTDMVVNIFLRDEKPATEVYHIF